MTIDRSILARWHGGKRNISDIVAIVFHYTGNSGTSASAKGNANYFAQTDRKASAHYCVDTKDTVYECVPLDTVAWSVGDGQGGPFGRLVNNWNSVSIEMVSCSDANGYYIPEQTIINAGKLYRWLLTQLPNVRYTIRHYDVSLKQCPAPLIDETKWAAFKSRILEDEIEMTKDELMSCKDTGDNPSAWAKAATEWAKENKVFGGDGAGNFGWQQPITREAVAQIIYNFAKKNGLA